MNPSRRNFLKKSAIAVSALGATSVIPSKVWSSEIAASDKINVALIGCRNMGFGILKHHLDTGMVNCLALCDVDKNVLKEKYKLVKKDYNQSPELFADYRKVLERKNIDAVIIGTPDHWHCLIMVEASQAGKDVYVEKPMSNTIGECNIMVKAANKYNRVVQVGQQQRDNKVFLDAMQLIKSGEIGTLRKVNIWANFNYGLGSTPKPDGKVPNGVDYDFWLGPAPKRPFNPNRFHGSWRHYWDYGGGLMSDWGVHLLDMGIWAGDLVEAPKKVITYAANLSKKEMQRETFDTMNVVFPKDNYVINWDMTAGIQQGPFDSSYGVQFIGENGTLVADRHKYHLYPEWDNDKKAPKVEAISFEKGRESHRQHVDNFLECIKSREKTSCPPEVGRAAALHAHIPNIAARVGADILEWDDKNNQFTNCDKANELITPVYRAPWKLPEL
ncbi:MAG: Gfo/Idh/MocA family oxidoreductase [Prolixibacteraceae bacterium]|jgi:predicted dehydrogenase|nr:Gfo/Idh/MocA family oxidoreductase [Prolixibacteraceae bacterium]MBT6763859.1 Gfo/Idh/MocA family oxidoreductase [Prolixibacteraceae bacterium]MBT6997101.1 Gfo/Idh/MocA family oxidoreductase [Prolixibacteraceae bacterium]MBT7393366.1 Gfo/Idh/MocA family oxidoreductase [Prolixibacteraceae bacterium]